MIPTCSNGYKQLALSYSSDLTGRWSKELIQVKDDARSSRIAPCLRFQEVRR